MGAMVLSVVISGYHRRRARQSGTVIPRRAEGIPALLLRAGAGSLLLAALLAAVVAPPWMSWATVELPIALRWVGAGVACACLPVLWWVFTSIGRNISETVLTKTDHQLVTHGPYRWVRHPLYATALVEILALAMAAANWLLFALGLVAAMAFRLMVIPREEANLVQAFGADYEAYRRRTGALVPRLWVRGG